MAWFRVIEEVKIIRKSKILKCTSGRKRNKECQPELPNRWKVINRFFIKLVKETVIKPFLLIELGSPLALYSAKENESLGIKHLNTKNNVSNKLVELSKQITSHGLKNHFLHVKPLVREQ